jgi:hypothetical protein
MKRAIIAPTIHVCSSATTIAYLVDVTGHSLETMLTIATNLKKAQVHA